MLKVCTQCSHTWEEFKLKGVLGCPKCYSAFSEELRKFFAGYQGQIRHDRTNKLSPPTQKTHTRSDELISLREKLANAIIKENFEEAAALKKQIYQLETNNELD